jgi:hypothetical protein
VEQFRRVHGELLVRGEHAQVRVPPDLDGTLAGQPGQFRGCPRHPPRYFGQRYVPAARRRPHRGQAELQTGDAAPRLTEVAGVEAFQLGGARRVVAHHAVDDAVGEPLPQHVLVGGVADRRAALELRRAVLDLLRGQREVVRAGLDGDRHPVAARGRDHR